MRCHGPALSSLFAGVLLGLLVLARVASAQIPSWVDNNPANAPQLPRLACPCTLASECAPISAPIPAPAAKHHGCVADWLKSCRLARLARRAERYAENLCDPCARGCHACEACRSGAPCHGAGSCDGGGGGSCEGGACDGGCSPDGDCQGGAEGPYCDDCAARHTAAGGGYAFRDQPSRGHQAGKAIPMRAMNRAPSRLASDAGPASRSSAGNYRGGTSVWEKPLR